MHAAALPLSVTLAVLAAAVTHATWNAIAHGIKDQVLAFALIGAGGIVVAVPLVLVSRFPLGACGAALGGLWRRFGRLRRGFGRLRRGFGRLRRGFGRLRRGFGCLRRWFG